MPLLFLVKTSKERGTKPPKTAKRNNLSTSPLSTCLRSTQLKTSKHYYYNSLCGANKTVKAKLTKVLMPFFKFLPGRPSSSAARSLRREALFSIWNGGTYIFRYLYQN